MKNSINLLFLLLIGGNSLFSQAYQKMIETGNRWNYIDYPPTLLAAENYYEDRYRETYSYWISNDTTIGQTKYKILMCDHHMYEEIQTFYAGAFREDTVNQQVYFVEALSTTEQLAYTFNHAIGDTLRIDTFGLDRIIRYVNAIDTVNVGDKLSRRFEICEVFYNSNTPLSAFYWIEGIGSLNQLLYMTCSNYPWYGSDFEPALLCFWHNDEQRYHNPAYDSCVYTSPPYVDIKNTRNHEGIILFPNPVSGLLHVACAESLLKIELLDLEGRLLRTTVRDEVDVSKLKEGIYFIRATTSSGRTVTEPFIKHER